MISFGTISEKVTLNNESSTSAPLKGFDGSGFAGGGGLVVNVYVLLECVAESNKPPVFERSIPDEPEVAPEGSSLDGCVRYLKASFSFLKGIVILAPCSSPLVINSTLAPGYLLDSVLFAFLMSEALIPDMPPLPALGVINDFGKRNAALTVTVPSALKTAPVS